MSAYVADTAMMYRYVMQPVVQQTTSSKRVQTVAQLPVHVQRL